jgi:hypothetical protein
MNGDFSTFDEGLGWGTPELFGAEPSWFSEPDLSGLSSDVSPNWYQGEPEVIQAGPRVENAQFFQAVSDSPSSTMNPKSSSNVDYMNAGANLIRAAGQVVSPVLGTEGIIYQRQAGAVVSAATTPSAASLGNLLSSFLSPAKKQTGLGLTTPIVTGTKAAQITGSIWPLLIGAGAILFLVMKR